jgi:hypothetical protein
MTDKIAINQHSSPVGHSIGGARFAANLGSKTSVMAERKNFKESGKVNKVCPQNSPIEG